MKVILKGVHITLTERLKAYVDEHLVAPIERFFDDEAAELDIHLVDSNGPKGGRDKECRVTAFIPGSAPMHITEATDDLFQSIDFARDRLEKTIKREQERKRMVTGHPSLKPSAQFDKALGGSIPDDLPVE